MEIATYTWPDQSRPCSFCLCLQDGCVFADFDADSQGLVRLRRISFDGYGCCKTDVTATTMTGDDSLLLTDCIAAGDVNNDQVRDILFRYFDINKNAMWR